MAERKGVTRILGLDIYEGRLRVGFVDDDGKLTAVFVERADADEDDTMLKNPGVGRTMVRNAIAQVNAVAEHFRTGLEVEENPDGSMRILFDGAVVGTFSSIAAAHESLEQELQQALDQRFRRAPRRRTDRVLVQ